MKINGSAFTIASARVLEYAQVRGMVKLALRKVGKKKVFCVMATDGHWNRGQGWHVAFYDLVFTSEEVDSIAASFEHYRQKLDLGSKNLFFKYGVERTEEYVRNHPSVFEWCKVA